MGEREDGQRVYRDMSSLITAEEAKRRYMKPRLIDRANASMSREELSALILHHAEELRWLLDSHFRPMASGDHSGPRIGKERLAKMANQLHDWWNTADMHKCARAGEPIIWED